jgi:hypothetical protein
MKRAFEKQLAALENLCQICQLLQCRISVFQLFYPGRAGSERYREGGTGKNRRFVQVRNDTA